MGIINQNNNNYQNNAHTHTQGYDQNYYYILFELELFDHMIHMNFAFRSYES